jgi:hypothetical protein
LLGFNDCISYVLRSLIILELYLNQHIVLCNRKVLINPSRPELPENLDFIQKEALKLIETDNQIYSVQNWIDFLSGIFSFH